MCRRPSFARPLSLPAAADGRSCWRPPREVGMSLCEWIDSHVYTGNVHMHNVRSKDESSRMYMCVLWMIHRGIHMEFKGNVHTCTFWISHRESTHVLGLCYRDVHAVRVRCVVESSGREI